ncbi:hypothetical protein M409DRAFT_17315 [Zasmidium cellare ATCC 36951]|uniref:Uncharacterized protein n=1 Tax=Zasmidium cellare ATCC 36951 TaxID=1080233 RepID=A0A6A6CZ97_ZASCE|nr:uncharacterized protein M409DRAFT_17315 [Zasmidium cellare ATCC 36951]KAF2172073.1 hypothetical protein M409DRAFT_17315 [Zasmidium cellare ATCC 36951]
MSKTSHVQDGSPKCQEIIAELEKRAQANIEAMNNRDFSPSSPLYHLRAKDWRAEAGDGESWKEMALHEYVESLRTITTENPELKATLRDMSTTVNAKLDSARIFVNVEIEGIPVGISRHAVVLLEYRWMETDWVSCSHRVLGGMSVNLME